MLRAGGLWPVIWNLLTNICGKWHNLLLHRIEDLSRGNYNLASSRIKKGSRDNGKRTPPNGNKSFLSFYKEVVTFLVLLLETAMTG